MSDIVDLSRYSVDAVYAHLGLSEDQTEAREAVRFVYNYYAHGEGKSDTPELAVTETIEFIQPRLDILNYNESDFFPDNNHEWDALLIAALCDRMIQHASNLTETDSKETNTNKQPDFSDDYAIKHAEVIFEYASDLISRGLLPDEVVPPEAVFLAVLNSTLDFTHALAKVETYDEDALLGIRKEIGNVNTFAPRELSLGKELVGIMDELSNAIDEQLPRTCRINIKFNRVSKYAFFDCTDRDNYTIRQLMDYMPISTRATRDAMKAFWYSCLELYEEQAGDAAESITDEFLPSFTKYAGGIGLSDQEYETALCSWLLIHVVDPSEERHTHLMTDKTMAILDNVSQPDTVMPTLSQCLGDKALFTHLGLRASHQLNRQISAYEKGTKAKTASEGEIQVEIAYAAALLAEDSPFPCQLADDVKEKAARLLSLTQPVLARRQMLAVTNNPLAPPTLHV